MESSPSKVKRFSQQTIKAVRDSFRQSDLGGQYERLSSEPNGLAPPRRPASAGYNVENTAIQDEESRGEPFSWFEYFIFLLLGIAMLWAW